MKKYVFILTVFFTVVTTAQNNIFPTLGNAGIKTTTPNAQLVVGNSFGASISGTSAGNAIFGTNLALYQGGTNHNKLYTPYSHSNSYGYAGMQTSWGKINFYTQSGNSTANQLVNPIPRVTITTSGNVGIGTTAPGAKLHVSSGTQLRKTTIGLTTASVDNSWIRDEWLTGSYGPAKWNQTTKKWVRPGGTYNDIGGIVYQDEGTYFLREKAGSKLEFSNTEFLNTAFMFAHISTGNIGIGTTTPDEKLAVNGNIHAKEVRVDLTGWPDYVFEDTYTLPTLQQVEKHIAKKGHLINIPSAAEVEEKGVQLGEMNKRLLEKIEELTLYTISQQKEIKALQEVKTKNIELEARLTKIEAVLNKK